MSTTEPGKADREVIRALESHRGDLTRFASWLTRGDRTVAEDIVQETMLRAWRARGDLREPAAFRAWLFAIVRREHARLHERRRLLVVDLEECPRHEVEGTARCDEDPQIDDLRKAILALPDQYRVPLAMQVLGGFTTVEIAAELGLTSSAVLTRLFRARNRLRELFADSYAG